MWVYWAHELFVLYTFRSQKVKMIVILPQRDIVLSEISQTEKGKHCMILPFFFFFLVFMAAPVAHGSSQARGPIGATVLACATATRDPSLICDLYQRSWQCRILNSLSEARDRTCILMDPSRVR